MKVRFLYDVDDSVIHHEIVETGEPAERTRSVRFELTELSPAARAHVACLFQQTEDLLDCRGEPRAEIEIVLGTFQAEQTWKDIYSLAVKPERFGIPQLTLADCESALAALAQSKPSAEADLAAHERSAAKLWG